MESSAHKYLYSLIAEGEHQQLDFKFEISDARKIARTLSAFSNTEGGRLLIGVKDNGRISGIRSEEEYYMLESAASLYCKPEIRFESRNHSIEGRNILEIYIPPVSKKPVYAQQEDKRWMAYIRVGDQNALAGIVQLQVWKEKHKSHGPLLSYTRKEEILLHTLEQQPGISLSRLQRDTGFPRNKLVNLLTKLVLFDVVDIRYEELISRFYLREDPGA